MQSDDFTITTDGEPISADNAEQAFEYGGTIPTAEVGISLPNVRALARVHGWRTTLDTAYTDGVRLIITDGERIET